MLNKNQCEWNWAKFDGTRELVQDKVNVFINIKIEFV